MNDKYFEKLKNCSCSSLSTLAEFETSDKHMTDDEIAICSLARVVKYGTCDDVAIAIDMYSTFSYAKNQLKANNENKQSTIGVVAH